MRVVLILTLALGGLGGPLCAQTPAADSTRRELPPLFTMRDVYFVAGFTAGTIAAFPLDEYLAEQLQDSTTQANQLFDAAATGFNVTARPGSFIIGGSLYALGKVTRNRRMADLGLHGTEALLLNEAVTRFIKAMAGRARPRVDRENARDFGLTRGFGDHEHQSFPSGHTSSAFAAAAVVTSEVGEWWPKWKPLIGTAMFGGASLAGLSRMYGNHHWASDVMVGAALGSFVGWKVVRFHHIRPEGGLDRILMATTVAPTRDGTALMWVIPVN